MYLGGKKSKERETDQGGRKVKIQKGRNPEYKFTSLKQNLPLSL